MTRKRTFLYACPVCLHWRSVASRELQAICREAGACPQCVRDDFFVLRMKIVALELHLAQLVAHGKTAPEDKRPALRRIWTKRNGQLQQARAALLALQERRSMPTGATVGMTGREREG